MHDAVSIALLRCNSYPGTPSFIYAALCRAVMGKLFWEGAKEKRKKL
jgi:hypothetical protein